ITYIPTKFCDNLRCHTVANKITFRCCSRCLSVSYCSKQCQETDWKAHHRGLCEEAIPDVLSARTLGFLRFLVHYDYEQNKSRVYGLRLASKLSGFGCYIKFDYTSGKVRLMLESTDKWPPIDLSPKSYEVKYRWKEIVSRAEDAAGELNIDVVQFPDGMGNNYRIIPMRCSFPAYHARIAELEKQLEGGQVLVEECHTRIDELVRGLGNIITEIHW
ncbi:hypothetical protein R3P38DRAFT_3013812, partial [Favolaschia claudopus]